MPPSLLPNRAWMFTSMYPWALFYDSFLWANNWQFYFFYPRDLFCKALQGPKGSWYCAQGRHGGDYYRMTMELDFRLGELCIYRSFVFTKIQLFSSCSCFNGAATANTGFQAACVMMVAWTRLGLAMQGLQRGFLRLHCRYWLMSSRMIDQIIEICTTAPCEHHCPGSWFKKAITSFRYIKKPDVDDHLPIIY